MKICWDNLEGMYLANNGKFVRRTGSGKLHYYDERICVWCGDSFLGKNDSALCNRSCASKKAVYDKMKGNRYGMLVAIEKVGVVPDSKDNVGIWKLRCDCGNYIEKPSTYLASSKRFKEPANCGCVANNRLVGKRFGRLKVLKCVSNHRKWHGRLWKCVCDCGTIKNIAGSHLTAGHTVSCGCYRKEVCVSKPWPIEKTFGKQGLTAFKTHEKFLINIDPIRPKMVGGLEVLEVRCSYCGRWFCPSRNEVGTRKSCLEGKMQGEGRFYCSNNCRRACPIYNKQKWPDGYKPATSREVQPELRQMVLERDNWTCQHGNCGKTIKDTELHCHHFEGINLNPLESADLDMCITLCKKHHKEAHKQRGCTYNDMKCV